MKASEFSRPLWKASPVRGKQDNRACPGVSLALCVCTVRHMYKPCVCTQRDAPMSERELSPGPREKGSVFIAIGALSAREGDLKHSSSKSQHTFGKIVRKPHVTLHSWLRGSMGFEKYKKWAKLDPCFSFNKHTKQEILYFLGWS